MSCNRYLLHFAYIGTHFHGAQKQVRGRGDDPSTIQGQLEQSLKLLNPCNDPAVALSSRTDSGVHAFNSTCHVDLFRQNGLIYEPRTLTLCLNKHFAKENTPIRILKTYLIPSDFHCRHRAISRIYLYRLAIMQTDSMNNVPHLDLLPIEDNNRCLYLCTSTFDVEAMREASKLFLGLHDFRTFMSRERREVLKITRRHIYKFDVFSANSRTYSPYSWPNVVESKDYKFYDIYVEANSFLYRQVRRMVAVLIGIAQGKVSESDIKLMLQVPSQHSWNERLKTVPAYALYLCKVNYSAGDQALFRATSPEEQ